MMERKKFLILDIDGVLLEAQGYRAACMDTINDFIHQMGHPDLSVTREIADVFEASGISAEWDMVPLALAAFVNWYAEQTGDVINNNTFPPLCSKKGPFDNQGLRIMLLDQIKEYASLLNPDESPIDAIYHGYLEHKANGLSYIWNLPIRDRFFINTLNPFKSPYFAQLICRLLGNKTFEAFYGLQAPIVCESYLETKDHLLISEYYRNLLPEISGKTAYPVVMTYRPTVLPVKGNNISSYYVNTPEGECALKLLGWADGRIPMIGCGSLCYIEEKYRLRREQYVKPHPFHALAAVIDAICRNEVRALELARQLCESDPDEDENPIKSLLPVEQPIDLAVFEDSVSGIESVRSAAAILKQWRYDVRTELCGISSTEAKDARLANAGVMIYNNINSALDVVIGKK